VKKGEKLVSPVRSQGAQFEGPGSLVVIGTLLAVGTLLLSGPCLDVGLPRWKGGDGAVLARPCPSRALPA